MADCTLRASEVAKGITLTFSLTGVRSFRFRIWLAGMIFRFGGLVAGVTAHIEK